jgi:hypothetical protein
VVVVVVEVEVVVVVVVVVVVLVEIGRVVGGSGVHGIHQAIAAPPDTPHRRWSRKRRCGTRTP